MILIKLSVLQRHKNHVLQTRYNSFPNKPLFLRAYIISLSKTLGKGEIAPNKQFLLYPQHFLPLWRIFHHFHQICNCKLQTLSVRDSLEFVVWKRLDAFAEVQTHLSLQSGQANMSLNLSLSLFFLAY